MPGPAVLELRLLEYMRDRQADIIALVRRLVELESPTGNKAAVDRVGSAVADAAEGISKVTRYPQAEYGDHLKIAFDVPSRGDGQLLGLGHIDTVWEIGTLERMPWRHERARYWGPGVFDMKAGVAYLLFAAFALRDLGVRSRRRFVVQLNSDEEVGSPSSTQYTVGEARRSSAVLVAEPSAGLDGRAKTARKGGGTYQITVRGLAAHAGLDFFAGASAIVELARLVRVVSSWSDKQSGVTVNPGVIQGGTASNVVAERASASIDVRFTSAKQAEAIEERFRALVPSDPRCEIQVSGGARKMPLERTPDVVRLFRSAQAISGRMGVSLGEASVGGGSDGNTTAAMGVPTLDGMGAVGEGAHSLGESILESRVADRAALIAGLLCEI